MSDGYSGGFWKNVRGDMRHYKSNAGGNIQSGVDVLSGGSKNAAASSATQGLRYAATPDVGTTDERRDALYRKYYDEGGMSRAEYERQLRLLDIEDEEEAKRKAGASRAAEEVRAAEAAEAERKRAKARSEIERKQGKV